MANARYLEPWITRDLEAKRSASLDRLAARGQVTRAGHAKKGWSFSPSHLGLAEGAVRDLLEDLRDDR